MNNACATGSTALFLARQIVEGGKFLRAIAECFAYFSLIWASVCPSVHLSVCSALVICIETVQARITKSSPSAAYRSLVIRDKISCFWVRGFPSNKDVKEGYSLKRCYFCVIGSYSVKTVADRYRLEMGIELKPEPNEPN